MSGRLMGVPLVSVLQTRGLVSRMQCGAPPRVAAPSLLRLGAVHC